jgi:hypothetical protein
LRQAQSNLSTLLKSFAFNRYQPAPNSKASSPVVMSLIYSK